MKPFDPEKLPPKDLDLVALMPLVGKANRNIATLEGLFYGIPNPNVLLSPITTQEAVLSSKIEGTQADFEEVLKFEAGESPGEPSKRDDIHEIMNYRKALHLSESLLKDRPFCLNSLLKLHGVLMDNVRGHPPAAIAQRSDGCHPPRQTPPQRNFAYCARRCRTSAPCPRPRRTHQSLRRKESAMSRAASPIRS